LGSNLLLIAIALLLVVLNGFFVAAEFGLVKLRQTRVKAIAKNYGWRGRILIKVHRDLDAYLSACQLGITLASLALGWIGEPAFADLLRPMLTAIGIEGKQTVHVIAFGMAFFITSYLHIVLGELAPKSIAIRLTDKIALWTAAPLYAFYWLMYPVIWVLNHSAAWVLRKVGLDIAKGHDSHYSAEEMKLILRNTPASADYTAYEWRVLAQALDFHKLDVADLMRPFSEVVALFEQDSLADNLGRIAQHRYSRYPYLDSAGHALGMIHVKDIFIAQQKTVSLTHLGTLVRPILTVSPNFSAAELYRQFRKGAAHLALVGVPGERPLGFVTLDNLLGALVGKIRDEFRQSDNDWTQLDDGSLIGKGSLPIMTLERALGIDIKDNDADSVAGLILEQLGELPTEGQRIRFERFDAVVKKMRGPRIVLLRIYPH
jgi:CBS domain containing-hemolysin-like protein